MDKDNDVLVDYKKLRKLISKSDRLESVMHGLVLTAYYKAPELRTLYKNRDWEGFIQVSEFIKTVFKNVGSAVLNRAIDKLVTLSYSKSETPELYLAVEEIGEKSKGVIVDIENYIRN